MGKSPYNGVFSRPLSKESAYWLGFIWADGSIGVYGRGHRFAVGLKKSDADHLESLADFLGYNKTRVSKRNGTVVFQVNSVELYNDLTGHGLHQNKSQSIDDIYCEERYMNHFVRGLFDGDGSIGVYEISGREYMRPQFSFTGRELPVALVKDVIEDWADVQLGKIRQQKNGTYCVETAARGNMKPIFEIFYSDGGPYLCRKKEIFKEAVNTPAPKPGYRRDYDRYDENGRALVEITCDYCGESAWKRADHASRSKNNYCSRPCSGRANYKKANEARWD